MNLFLIVLSALFSTICGICTQGGKELTIGMAWYENMFLYKSYKAAILRAARQTMYSIPSTSPLCGNYTFKFGATIDLLNKHTKIADWQSLSENVLIYFLTSGYDYQQKTVNRTKAFLEFTMRNGIPTISWTPDNPSIAKPSENYIDISPKMSDQAKAISSLLTHYNWKEIAIVTATRSGTDEFQQEMKRLADGQEREILHNGKLEILSDETIREELTKVRDSEAKIIILNTDYQEADIVFKHAGELNLTGDGYVWILTKSGVGDTHSHVIDQAEYRKFFNRYIKGAMAITFDTSKEGQKVALELATKMYVLGMNEVVKRPGFTIKDVKPGWGQTTIAETVLDYIRKASDPETEGTYFHNRELKTLELEVVTWTGTEWKIITKWSKQDGLKTIIWPEGVPAPAEQLPISRSANLAASNLSIVLFLCSLYWSIS